MQRVLAVAAAAFLVGCGGDTNSSAKGEGKSEVVPGQADSNVQSK